MPSTWSRGEVAGEVPGDVAVDVGLVLLLLVIDMSDSVYRVEERALVNSYKYFLNININKDILY